MKRMLINATEEEELRVALVNGQTLYDLDIERPGREQKKSNIYSGTIRHLETSLDAAFVDFGAERHGFLPFKEIVLTKEQQTAIERGERLGVRDVLREGQQVMVQVEKEERGNKGAALTTFISLAGCYLVLMPNNPGAGGISRRIDGEARQEIKDSLSQITLPDGMGVIIRTAGVGRSVEELQWDLNVQLRLWDVIQQAYQNRQGAYLIYQESDVVMRSIRDYLRQDIGEILIDNPEIFERAKKHIELVRPDFVDHIKFYDERVPLFSRFHIESQIESAYQREVTLPSGGAIVIDHTEALVAIDINSARATRGGDIEETALLTNLEAADEIARQLRLRDIGGLIVIDFIDMGPIRNQREVENRLREATKMDRARIQIGRISRFGLMEMSRQRLRPSLGEASQLTCPRCHGTGGIRGIESSALAILRLIEENAMREKTAQIRVQLPVDVATFILNEKREAVSKIEAQHKVHIIIVPNPHYEIPNFTIERVKQEDASGGLPSYQMVAAPEVKLPYEIKEKNVREEVQPAIKAYDTAKLMPEAPPKKAAPAKEPIIRRLLDSLFGKKEEPAAPAKKEVRNTGGNRNHPRSQQRSGGNGGKPRTRRPQGLSVKDVVKAQADQANRSGNNKPPHARPPRNPESNPRRERPERTERPERKPRPENNDNRLVVKISTGQSPVENSANASLKSPVVVPETTASVPVVVKETVVSVATPAAVPHGEDIFAKAQRMLAQQTAKPVAATVEKNLPQETARNETASVTPEVSSDHQPLVADGQQDKNAQRRQGHGRLRGGKGRRGFGHGKKTFSNQNNRPAGADANPTTSDVPPSSDKQE